MHDLDGIVCIFLTLELDKAIPLMFIGDFIPGDVHVDYWSTLRKQFPEDIFVDLLIDVSRVDRSLLVPLIKGRYCRHPLIILL